MRPCFFSFLILASCLLLSSAPALAQKKDLSGEVYDGASDGRSSDDWLSGSAADGDDGQMAAAGVEIDNEFQLHAGLALHEDLRLRTWRAARPVRTRLPARLSTRPAATPVDLVRRRSI